MRQQDVTTPHFSVPFRFGGINGGAFLNEQDDIDDVTDCIKALLAYPEGSHEVLEGFGTPDIVFKEDTQPMSHLLEHAIRRWESRADVIINDRPDAFDDLIRRTTINLRTSDEAG